MLQFHNVWWTLRKFKIAVVHFLDLLKYLFYQIKLSFRTNDRYKLSINEGQSFGCLWSRICYINLCFRQKSDGNLFPDLICLGPRAKIWINFFYARLRILLQGNKEVSGFNVLLLNKYEGKLQFRNHLAHCQAILLTC